jgi:large subunit ribosomal protein L2
MTYVEAGLKHFKPFTPSMRHTVLIDKSKLWRGRPVKELTRRKLRKAGRSFGTITVRHQGGGHHQLYRFVDFARTRYDEPAVIQRFEYDPNRSAFIALIRYPDESLSYILAPQEVKVGDTVMSSEKDGAEIKPGNAMPLAFIPVGTRVHNVEMKVGGGGEYSRSAGSSALVMDKRAKPGYALLQGPSKEQRFVRLGCMATVGSVSNPMHHLRKLGKAGRNRWLGVRPTVRGMAMNPIDHPLGGGNGRTKGRQPCSPTGVLAKGYKTGKFRKPNPLIFIQRGGPKVKK